MTVNRVRVGIVGLGTVGSGTFNVLTRNAAEIARRAGVPIEVVHVAARRDHPNADTSGVRVSRDPWAVVNDPEVDILVELIGGTTLARELVLKAIANGKHVITANKALIALHGNEIFAAATEKDVDVDFEAAVAGGIPIIKSIREGLSANHIDWLAGIINGTSNFILTEMRDKGRSFGEVLAEAQALGYAEADPTFDVEGVDAAHKLTILASVAFGIPLQFDKVYTEGISRLTADDVAYAEALGYRIKLLGIARRVKDGIELRVHPALIPERRLIASVDGVMNAVMVHGDAVGPTLYYGRGAGSEPTASAVVADVIDTARNIVLDAANRIPHLAFQPDQLSDVPVLPIEEVETAYYLRLMATDKPGVLAEVTRILSEAGISIEAILQKPVGDRRQVPVIILTHRVREKKMNAALAKIRALPEIEEEIMRIRLESLDH
ncbi:MAG: homoserine dehydrogenase [Gammaproteobacteria bacterium]